MQVSNSVFSAEMNLVLAPFGMIRFEVDSTSIALSNMTPNAQCAVYPYNANNDLRINCLNIDNNNYWVELSSVPNLSAIWFDVVNFAQLP